ncbi:alpha/beta hydrolase [Nereida sp. MMG025]|uniref:alpha/beta hydrolase n=1 Tax=Nereida sp. MMG025 TaxID=2909981 RepID=UPI001F383765|nr:alpha/beta hydrolase [Nereida sp. MMG025]MCF6445464.1 alpha/beta hydrolase [Nereida sp. MMG025]
MDYDEAYENGRFIPNGAAYFDIWGQKAAVFRDQHRGELKVPYGDGARQWFDVFVPDRPKGLLAFVHGGYWHKTDPHVWSHLAAGAVSCGWAVAMIGYTLAPQARIAQMTQEVAKGIDLAAVRFDGPVVIAGHSAGGHLAARMACDDIALQCADRLQRVMPISPLTDLRELAKTSMPLGLDAEEAAAESPILCRPRDVKVHVWVGASERPVFLDHAGWLQDTWDCTLTVEPDKHHFDVIEGLEDARSPMIRALIGQV